MRVDKGAEQAQTLLPQRWAGAGEAKECSFVIALFGESRELFLFFLCSISHRGTMPFAPYKLFNLYFYKSR